MGRAWCLVSLSILDPDSPKQERTLYKFFCQSCTFPHCDGRSKNVVLTVKTGTDALSVLFNFVRRFVYVCLRNTGVLMTRDKLYRHSGGVYSGLNQ